MVYIEIMEKENGNYYLIIGYILGYIYICVYIHVCICKSGASERNFQNGPSFENTFGTAGRRISWPPRLEGVMPGMSLERRFEGWELTFFLCFSFRGVPSGLLECYDTGEQELLHESLHPHILTIMTAAWLG